jgi:hypothetical protein
MPEEVMGAVWAFCWGLAAAPDVLLGAVLGLTTSLRHRAIAAIMSLGAGVAPLGSMWLEQFASRNILAPVIPS